MTQLQASSDEKEVLVFHYEQLDDSTADFLRKKESNMREIVGKAYTELGQELAEARDRLAGSNQYDGVFEKWYTSFGFKKDRVYDLMRRYELLVGISEDQTRELLEDLPVSLSYEIAKPSAESTEAKAQAKAEVLTGEVATLKEYRERIVELEERAKQAEAQTKTAQRSEEITRRQLDELTDVEPEVVVKTEYVEILKEDTTASERLKKYEERFGDIDNYSGRVRATNVSDATTAIVSFNMAVRDFIKRHAFLIKYNDTIQYVDQVTQREYNEAVQALKEISADFCAATGNGDYLDAVFSEIH